MYIYVENKKGEIKNVEIKKCRMRTLKKLTSKMYMCRNLEMQKKLRKNI